MKKIILVLTLFLCWQNAYPQHPSWFVDITSFSVFGQTNPYEIESKLSCVIDDDFGFNLFSLSQTGTFSSLNGFNYKSLSPYIFVSYNPWHAYSYTSLGVSREVLGCVAYVELGISDADYKNWSIGAGVIYSLELPKFSFKNIFYKKRFSSS